MQSIATRRIPIHQSLLRPHLLAGGERQLTLLNVTMSAALIFGVGGIAGIGTGIALGLLVQWVLALMARRDPQAFDVYRRHIHQQKFYAAAAWVDARRSPPRS